MPRYVVTGSLVQEISVEVEADSVEEAINKADLVRLDCVDVWDTTKLWADAEVTHDEQW